MTEAIPNFFDIPFNTLSGTPDIMPTSLAVTVQGIRKNLPTVTVKLVRIVNSSKMFLKDEKICYKMLQILYLG